jgi:hypothetical protein
MEQVKSDIYDDMHHKFYAKHGFFPSLEDTELLIKIGNHEGTIPRNLMSQTLSDVLLEYNVLQTSKHKSNATLTMSMIIPKPKEKEESDDAEVKDESIIDDFVFDIPKTEKHPRSDDETVIGPAGRRKSTRAKAKKARQSI